jgi:hypothetical protein
VKAHRVIAHPALCLGPGRFIVAVQPPNLATIQAGHACECGGWRLFCRSVLPSCFVSMASAVGSKTGSITSSAGLGLPWRASTNWIVRHAAANLTTEQASSVVHLSRFQPHSIALQRTKHLFDTPAQAIHFARCVGVATLDAGPPFKTGSGNQQVNRFTSQMCGYPWGRLRYTARSRAEWPRRFSTSPRTATPTLGRDSPPSGRMCRV